VRSAPTDLTPDRLGEELTRIWAIRPTAMDYVPEGGGSHHWHVVDAHGRRHFVTVDDLDDKDWLADSRDAAFGGLTMAYATAHLLQHVAGLAFVVAPVEAPGGDVLHRVDDRYALSVFPYLEGHAFPFGPYADPALRDEVVDLLAALHGSTATVRDRASNQPIRFGGRRDLEGFLAEPDRPWSAGPFSTAAHDLLLGHRTGLAELVGGFDRLVQRTDEARRKVVITHGEPHPANLLSAGGRLHLVDWDTCGLAPPERDLSLVIAAAGEGNEHYERMTGRVVDPSVVTLYQLRWYLDDLASAARLFRNPHAETPDTRLWWAGLAPRLEQLPAWLVRLS
jgi:spectinomycin phosphotransferase